MLLSATDKRFAFRKIRKGAKDRLSFKISHFAAQILRVDIQTKVSKNDPRFQVEEKDIGAFRPAPSTEFRGGTCCGSHFGWGAIFACFFVFFQEV